MTFLANFSLGALLDSTQITWTTAFFILGGVGQTCLLIFLAMASGLILGVALASFQVYGPPWTARLVSVYVWFFRSIPIIVLLFMFYLGLFSQIDALLSELFGTRFRTPAFPVAAIVLGLTSAAYQSQIFRGAMQSIPSGQLRAAKALGLSQAGAIRSIILPQALRISIPAWSNEYSILLKDSAIAFVLGVSETIARIKQLAATNHQPLLMFILAGILYYLLTWAGVKLLMKLHERVRIPGLAEVDHSGY